MSGAERVTGPRAVETVADRLREEVLTGGLRPGEPLREESLADRFAVSRHTVRSALAALATERLLVAAPYRGMRVSDLDDVQLAELQQLRAAIESEAVRTVADAGGSFDGAAAAIDDLGALEESGAEWVDIQRAHAAVHQAIVDAAGSGRLSAVYRGLEGELSLLLLHTRAVFDGRDLAEEHRELIADLERRGADAVRDHLARSTRELLALRASKG